MRILLVEDDALLGSAVERALRAQTHAVDHVTTLALARTALRTTSYDLALVDLGLPDGDGLRLVESMSGQEDRPGVIVISARSQIGDRIKALDAGADDYLVKPFDLDELQARLRAVRRRGGSATSTVIRIGDVDFDPAAKRVFRGGEEIALSLREYQVLAALIERRGRVLSREQIGSAIYGWDDEVGSNTVEVFVHGLRRKLGTDFIRTRRGQGYVIDEA